MYLTKVNPERNMKRFYSVTIQPTILGGCCLVRMHGRIGGSTRVLPPVVYTSPPAAQVALERLVARKKRRGYKDRTNFPIDNRDQTQ
mgnify:CR=1 FL=1